MKWEVELGFRQQEMRSIYLRPEVVEWLKTKLPEAQSAYDVETDPTEELDTFIANYVAGEPLVYERQLWPLYHREAGIWELKTRDLRMFGWFWRIDVFICAAIDDASRIKEFRLYAGYRDAAARFREQLDLDPPKFIEGEHPSDVVSAFSFP